MKNRETYLTQLTKKIEAEFFAPLGLAMPEKWRVTCGFPSRNALGKARRTVGQNWAPQASADGTNEIIISMTVGDVHEAAAILAHEMIHAVIGNDKGHGKEFRKVAIAIGLTGKMTATVAGEEFTKRITPIIKKLGKYPHAALDQQSRKKQSTRMIKCECACCGYVVRTSNKWINVAVPTCPDFDCDSHGEEMQIS